MTARILSHMIWNYLYWVRSKLYSWRHAKIFLLICEYAFVNTYIKRAKFCELQMNEWDIVCCVPSVNWESEKSLFQFSRKMSYDSLVKEGLIPQYWLARMTSEHTLVTQSAIRFCWTVAVALHCLPAFVFAYIDSVSNMIHLILTYFEFCLFDTCFAIVQKRWDKYDLLKAHSRSVTWTDGMLNCLLVCQSTIWFYSFDSYAYILSYSLLYYPNKIYASCFSIKKCCFYLIFGCRIQYNYSTTENKYYA